MCIGVVVVVIEVGNERQETADEACERLSDGSIHPYSPNCDDQSSDWTIPCVLGRRLCVWLHRFNILLLRIDFFALHGIHE